MTFRPRRPRFLLAALLLLGCVPLTVTSQDEDAQQLGNKGDVTNLYKKSYTDRTAFIRGEKKPLASSKDDQQVLEALAKFFAYRPTWVGVRNVPAELSKVAVEFEQDIVRQATNSSYAKLNQAFVQQLGKHLADHFGELFAKDFKTFTVAQVNAAQMLPVMSRLRQEEVGDLLVKIIEDPKQHDAVKLYAVKALREFFPVTALNDDQLIVAKQLTVKKDRDARRVKALVDYIERKWPADVDPDAVKFLRREAIITLGQAGVPAVTALKKAKSVEGPVAYGLLRVLVPGGLDPAPSTLEKIEAIIGVSKIKAGELLTGKDPAYDPGPSVALVAQGLHDVLNDYRADYPNLTQKKLPKVAWRIQSERLKQGLAELVANTKGMPGNAQAVQLEKGARDFFAAMNQKEFGQLERVDAFTKLVEGMQSLVKSGILYKNHEGHTIKLDSGKGG